MYQIAIIQNQSEMAHYGYADARPLISDLGYEPTLFTAANIDDLAKLLERGFFDAVVFGSNALNDKTIRTEVFSKDFCNIFQEWLAHGHGCLILHQLRLAGLEDSNLKFLPSPYELSAIVRPLSEKSAQGKLTLGDRASEHILFLYPDTITAQDIQLTALQFKSLPGLYWHSWNNPNLSHWEILIEDKSFGDSRPLVVALREPSDFRIVASALTLDWQKQKVFLKNILTYIVEGRHNTAILVDERKTSTAFDYLIGILQSRKFPFRKYFLRNDTDLERNLRKGVHTILVLGPFIDFSKVPEKILTLIKEKISTGYLKIVTLEEREPQMSSFSVTGGERDALQLLQTTELYIQDELRTEGYVDGSFWSTVETLQVLNSLQLSRGNYKTLLDKTFELASKHDRAGSYDEVFGVSCALLWLRGKYLGQDSPDTKASAQWIRERISNYDIREQALAYFTLADIQIISESEKNALIKMLNGLERARLSEIDVVMYLQAALAVQHIKVMDDFISVLKKQQSPSGAWVDLATTATAVSVLVELVKLKSASFNSETISTLENMIFKGIIFIQESFNKQATSVIKYPWEGKASTTIKCISAWLKFDELIDFPVYELAGTMEKYNLQSTFLQSGKQALGVLESLKQDNIELRKNIDKYLSDMILLKRQSRRTPYVILASALFYLLLTIFIAVFTLYSAGGFLSVLRVAFVDSWQVHLAIVSLIVAIASAPWAIRKVRGDSSNEHK